MTRQRKVKTAELREKEMGTGLARLGSQVLTRILDMPSFPGRVVVQSFISSPQGGELVLPEKLPSRGVEGSDQKVKLAAHSFGPSNGKGPA